MRHLAQSSIHFYWGMVNSFHCKISCFNRLGRQKRLGRGDSNCSFRNRKNHTGVYMRKNTTFGRRVNDIRWIFIQKLFNTITLCCGVLSKSKTYIKIPEILRMFGTRNFIWSIKFEESLCSTNFSIVKNRRALKCSGLKKKKKPLFATQ